MKKLLALLIAAAMVLAFAACDEAELDESLSGIEDDEGNGNSSLNTRSGKPPVMKDKNTGKIYTNLTFPIFQAG